MFAGAHWPSSSTTPSPNTHRFLYSILSFIWLGVVLSIALHRWLHSVPVVSLVVFAIVATIFCLVVHFLLMTKYAAPIYYSAILPMYRWCVSPRRGRLSRLLARSFCTWHQDAYLDLIEQSQQWNRTVLLKQEGIHGGTIFQPKKIASAPPLVVRREHLDSGLWKADRSFAIALLFNEIRFVRERHKWVMHVDLRNQSCAIYNNRGKEFLRSEFIPTDARTYLAYSRDTHAFLLGDVKKDVVGVHIKGLRWASGGFLTVAKWRGRQWVCLFFRDIEQVGWNLANGASETKDEYKHLDQIVYREMVEELVLCRGIPANHAQVTHLIPNAPGPQSTNGPYVPALVRKHAALRREHDGIRFEIVQGPDILAKPTPHEVEVTYHDHWRNTRSVTTANVLISLNPLELGAEVVRVGMVALDDDVRLLDGEVHHSETGDYLVRAPIGLLSLEFLKTAYRTSNGTLGSPVAATTSDDRRTLGTVPREAFHVFVDEIPLRQNRLRVLDERGDSQCHEAERLRKWAEILQPQFLQAEGDGALLKEDIAILLPVVWKSLELAFKHKVL